MDLLKRLNNHIMMMAPHQRDRVQGKLLIEARDEIKRLQELLRSMPKSFGITEKEIEGQPQSIGEYMQAEQDMGRRQT